MSTILGQHCLGILSTQCCPNSLRQNCARKLLVRYWPRGHRHVLKGKPFVVSNMSSGLLFNRVKYHRTTLALFVQCWFGSSFKVFMTTVNRD